MCIIFFANRSESFCLLRTMLIAQWTTLVAQWNSPEFWGSWPVQMIIWITVLLILLVVSYYIVERFRGSTGNDRISANQMLSNFRDLNSEGDIDDEEFRKIKSVLGPQLREELNNNDETT